MTVPYEVVDPHAATICGVRVVDGRVSLTDAQAAHYLRMGVIRGLETTFLPDPPAAPVRRRRARRADSEVTGLPPTNLPESPDGSPPMPYLPRETEGAPWEE